MPIFDLPLEQLQTYTGRNPRPRDFESFWDQALAELDRTNPDPEFSQVSSSCKFANLYDLHFTGVGGARIHAKLLRPKTKGATPAVLTFHGYSGSSGDWSWHFASAAQGFTVAAMDCRGQGGSSEDPGGVRGNTKDGHIVRGLDDEPRKLMFRQVFLDTAQLARVVMDLDSVDSTRVGAAGGSQGGGLTVACAALVPQIARAAPAYPFLSDYQRVWEMDLAKDAYVELRHFFRMFDPRHEREDEIFERLGYIDIQHLAPRIEARVLWFCGLMDTVCPPSSQFAAYNKIRSKKGMVIYPDFGHENLPDQSDLSFEFLAGL